MKLSNLLLVALNVLFVYSKTISPEATADVEGTNEADIENINNQSMNSIIFTKEDMEIFIKLLCSQAAASTVRSAIVMDTQYQSATRRANVIIARANMMAMLNTVNIRG